MIEKNISLYEAVRRSAVKYPLAPALEYMNKTIKYSKLLAQIDSLSDALVNLGIGAGDIVTVCLPNIPEAVYAFYAISKLGAIAHMVHPLTKRAQMEKFLAGIPTKAIFIMHSLTQGYFELAEKLGLKIITCNPTTSLAFYKRAIYGAINRTPKTSGVHIKYTDLFSLPAIPKSDLVQKSSTNAVFDANSSKSGGDLAVLLHSGGTSGEPKAIELSANAINSLAGKGSYIMDRENLCGKYMLSVLPMFHGFGLTMGIHAMLAHGGCDSIMPKFHRDATIKLLAKGKINYIIGVPILYNALLSHPQFCGEKLKNIDVAFVGGDFVAKNLMVHFDAKIKDSGGRGRLFEGYGLTETVTVACVNTHLKNKVGSVGQALPGIKIEAYNNDKLLPRGDCGELFISGDTLMNGYHNITKERVKDGNNNIKDEFFVTTNPSGKQTKWIKTGDYGYVDSDGYVFFMQRLKRIIKVSGINVFPSEIENLIIDQPNITNVCALEITSEKRGSMIRLFVETAEPAATHETMRKTFSDLIANHIGAHARPDSIIFLPKLPLTTVGKVDSSSLSHLH